MNDQETGCPKTPKIIPTELITPTKSIPLPDIAQTNGDKPTLVEDASARVFLKRVIPDKKEGLIFERDYSLIFEPVELGAYLKHASIDQKEKGGARWRKTIFLADCHGKVIIKVPYGDTMMDLSIKLRRKALFASYLCMVTQYKTGMWSKWKTQEGEKVRFAKTGELLSIIEKS